MYMFMYKGTFAHVWNNPLSRTWVSGWCIHFVLGRYWVIRRLISLDQSYLKTLKIGSYCFRAMCSALRD